MRRKNFFWLLCLILVLVMMPVIPLIRLGKVIHANEAGAVDINRLMWLGLGAGSKGIIAGMVSGLAPEAGIAPELGSGAVGFWLAQQGGSRMGPFGEGMLIASVGQLIRQPIESIFGKIGKPAPSPTPEKTASPSSTSSPETDKDAYLAAKYGIS